MPYNDLAKLDLVEKYEARRQSRERGGLEEPKKQNPVYPK